MGPLIQKVGSGKCDCNMSLIVTSENVPSELLEEFAYPEGY